MLDQAAHELQGASESLRGLERQSKGRGRGVAYRSELGLLPALVIGQLSVHERQTLEGMVLLDGPVQMRATVLAGVAEDGGILVHDSELVAVLGHFDLVVGDDGDDGEESACWLPALGAAASMLVQDVALQFDFDGVSLAEAFESAAREIGVALGKTVVDQRVQRRGHVASEVLSFTVSADDVWRSLVRAVIVEAGSTKQTGRGRGRDILLSSR